MREESPVSVLVVDDSDFFAEMTAETLAEEHGFETDFRTSAAAAMESLVDEPVDCIVSDYDMPGRDGLEFLEWVRDRFEDLPFILLTGRGDEEIASEAIAMGVADYLLKLEVVEDQQYERLANRIESVVEQHDTKRKYELLVDNTPDAIAQVTTDGEIVAANPGLGDALDADPDALVGQRLDDAMPDDVAAERLAVGRRVVESGETEHVEDTLDGRSFYTTFVPLDVHASAESFQMISRDITERKERERQLERQNERLERFASVVSHDLRNPLTVAESALDLIEEDVSPDNEEHLRKLDRSIDRMNDIIDDVLTLAVQGQTVTDPEPVSLERMVDDAWRYVDGDTASLGEVRDLRLRADPGRLQQLLGNLLRNAEEHAGDDPAVSVGPLDDADGFYVEDDGSGITDADREALFELGYSTSESGTGLGLTIVDQIASAHGWDVALAEDAEGARFEITGVDVE